MSDDNALLAIKQRFDGAYWYVVIRQPKKNRIANLGKASVIPSGFSVHACVEFVPVTTWFSSGFLLTKCQDKEVTGELNEPNA